MSTTVGLFGVHERWEGAAVWMSTISEVAAIVLGLAALALIRGRASRREAVPVRATSAARR